MKTIKNTAESILLKDHSLTHRAIETAKRTAIETAKRTK
jgi:hypothetical protein